MLAATSSEIVIPNASSNRMTSSMVFKSHDEG
jgi:hypothetical protein